MGITLAPLLLRLLESKSHKENNKVDVQYSLLYAAAGAFEAHTRMQVQQTSYVTTKRVMIRLLIDFPRGTFELEIGQNIRLQCVYCEQTERPPN